MAEIQVKEMHPKTVRMPNGSVEVVNEVVTRYLSKQEIYEIKTAPDVTTEEYIAANGMPDAVVEIVEEVVVVEDAPVEEAPVEEAPAPVEDVPAEAPVDEAPVAEVAEEVPAEEGNAEAVEESSEEDSSSHRRSRRK